MAEGGGVVGTLDEGLQLFQKLDKTSFICLRYGRSASEVLQDLCKRGRFFVFSLQHVELALVSMSRLEVHQECHHKLD